MSHSRLRLLSDAVRAGVCIAFWTSSRVVLCLLSSSSAFAQNAAQTPVPTARLVADINPNGSSSPQALAAIGRMLFFMANDGTHGNELWVTDGTEAGTRLVKDINKGAAGQLAVQGVAMGDSLLFSADDGTKTTGKELWISNGTEEGTTLLADINPGPGSSNPSGFVVSGSRAFFQATTAQGTHLWETDGTPGGTVIATDIAGNDISSPGSLRDINGVLYFSASTAAAGREPWKSDGTPAGTAQIADIIPGPIGSNPGEFTLVKGRVYFAATSTGIGAELWSTDGTAAGTTLVKDIASGLTSSGPTTLTAFGDSFLFVATESASGREMWISDGTDGGTQLLDDIVPGTGAGVPSTSIDVLGRLAVFYAQDNTHGKELWRTDGTTVGTTLVKDIAPGKATSSGGPFTTAAERAYFAATDGTTGLELWTTDGTAEGTVLVTDIQPGSGGSSPSGLMVAEGNLFFSANDGTHGAELWAVDLVPPSITLTHAADGENGWNRAFEQPVTVTITAFDRETGIAGPPVCTDDGTAIPVSGSESPFTTAVSGEGVHTVACTVADRAGNQTSATDTVKIDWTPPVITFSGNQASYTVDQFVTITCSASDALSGLASTTCEDVNRPAYEFPLGENSVAATAVDFAGNTAAASVTFTVRVDFASLANLVTRFTAGTDLDTSLNAKLAAAAAATGRGNLRARAGMLRAFAHEIAAQTGKALTADRAAILLSLAEAL